MRHDWVVAKLSDLADIEHGYPFEGRFFRDKPPGDILLTPGNFRIGGGFNDDNRKYYLGPVSDEFVLQQGDLLVTMTDLSKNGDTLGYPAFVPHVPGARFLHNQRLGKVIIKQEAPLDRRFLYYLLCSSGYRHEILAGATGTTVKHTSPQRILSFSFCLPPVPEQRAIAEILGALDDKIELNRRMNETLEAMARAIFKSWFVDFEPVRAKMEGRWRRGQSLPGLPADLYDLFPDSFEDSPLGKVPKGWRVVPFGKVAEIFDSKRVPLSSRERANRRGPFPYFGAAGILDHIDDYLFDGTFVLLGEDGSVVKPDGRPFVQYVWGKFWVNNHAHVLAGKGGVSSEHLALFLKDVNIAPYVTGAVQPKLNQANMCSILFLLPSDVVCRLFAYVVRPLYDAVKVNVEQSELLAALRDALLPKLISGEIRIGDATAVVSEAV